MLPLFVFEDVRIFVPKHGPDKDKKGYDDTFRVELTPYFFKKKPQSLIDAEMWWNKTTKQLDEMRKNIVDKVKEYSLQLICDELKKYLNALISYRNSPHHKNHKLPLEWRSFTWRNTTKNSLNFEIECVMYNYACYSIGTFKQWVQSEEKLTDTSFHLELLSKKIELFFGQASPVSSTSSLSSGSLALFDYKTIKDESKGSLFPLENLDPEKSNLEKKSIDLWCDKLKEISGIFSYLQEQGLTRSGCWEEEFRGFFDKDTCKRWSNQCLIYAMTLIFSKWMKFLRFTNSKGIEHEFKITAQLFALLFKLLSTIERSFQIQLRPISSQTFNTSVSPLNLESNWYIHWYCRLKMVLGFYMLSCTLDYNRWKNTTPLCAAELLSYCNVLLKIPSICPDVRTKTLYLANLLELYNLQISRGFVSNLDLDSFYRTTVVVYIDKLHTEHKIPKPTDIFDLKPTPFFVENSPTDTTVIDTIDEISSNTTIVNQKDTLLFLSILGIYLKETPIAAEGFINYLNTDKWKMTLKSCGFPEKDTDPHFEESKRMIELVGKLMKTNEFPLSLILS